MDTTFTVARPPMTMENLNKGDSASDQLPMRDELESV